MSTTASPTLNRKIAPPIHHAVSFQLHLPPYDEVALSNGVKVYSLHGGVEDVMQLELVFAAGNCVEEKPLVAAAANHLLRNGTATRTAFEISEHFDFYGSHLSTHCYNETATITLHTLSRHLPKLLPVLAELITQANFPQQELETFVQNSKQRLSVSLRKCEFVANREIDVLLYGKEHPYGRYSTHEDFDNLQQQDLIDFYQQHYAKGKCMLFLAGKLPAQLNELLEEHFGQLPLEPLETKVHAPKPFGKIEAAQRKHVITNDENGVQGAVRLAAHFGNRHHPDMPGVQVLNNLFGGFFGSRLMSNIREDKGYTYGIHSYLQNHVERGAWVVSTEAGRDVCEATINEVYHEMERLQSEPVDLEELLLVRNYMMGSLLGDLDGPFQVIGRWKAYILNGFTDDSYFKKAIHTIKHITPDELQVLAQRYLKPELFYELVVV